MNWHNVRLIFFREVLDQVRDRRTLFMILVLPVLLYPAMGVGIVPLIQFAEQPRTLVVLGADALPDPPLVDGDHLAAEWFRDPGDQKKIVVVSDAKSSSESREKSTLSEDKRWKLLDTAELFREPLDRQVVLAAQLAEAERIGDQQAIASLTKQRQELSASMSQLFATSGIHVLIVVPDGFARHVQEMEAAATQRQFDAMTTQYPRPILLRNSADEKSAMAALRVQKALNNWEHAILQNLLHDVGLPEELPSPVNPTEIDLAAENELAANVWSKLFPALLMMMALTGAFYPAIDLGAGEKERGTMETLLICPATRTEIVVGKFFTVMLFSMATALLNLSSAGLSGKYMLSLTGGGGGLSRLGDLSLPPITALAWVLVLLVPLSALFSALCLALATFAKSSKEGQYYLTPLLMLTLGLTMFCLSPAVEMQPFYSILPVMGPALLLKGLLLANHQTAGLFVYVAPVLISSLGYSFLALWWAIDQFGNEEVLFREAERFDLRLWVQHLLRDKEPTPTFSEATFAFIFIMMLQFLSLRILQAPLASASPAERPLVMMQVLIIQQLVIIATPPLLMGVMLTTSVVKTFRLQVPRWSDLAAVAVLPLVLHPLTLELSASLHWFFPPLPPNVNEAMAAMSSDQLPVWLVLLTFALAPAVCEEIAFRGFILSGFRHTGRDRLAIVMSGIAFGVMHLIPQQVVNAALLGILLGWIAVRTNSLWPGILFHLLYNGLEVCRNRFGNTLPIEGSWELLFRNESGLRYQPLLLFLCVVVAVGILSFLWRRQSVVAEMHDPRISPPLSGTHSAIMPR